MNRKYIVYRMQITKRDVNDNGGVNQYLDTILRIVNAKSKEEAIGKFIISTSNIDAVERLDVICHLLDETKTI